MYIYFNNLEYTVDCSNHTFECFQIKPRGLPSEDDV